MKQLDMNVAQQELNSITYLMFFPGIIDQNLVKKNRLIHNAELFSG